MSMEVHPTSENKSQQREFRCDDCGHLYFIALRQQSSLCAQCGNIAFHGSDARPLRDALEARTLAIPLKKTPQLMPELEVKKAPSGQAFPQAADGARVQQILRRYQVEWQIWSQVVKNFSDPDFHFAYYTVVANTGNFARGIERYQEHRNIMILQRENHWQAEISEMMAAKISALAAIVAEREVGHPSSFTAQLYLLPTQLQRVSRYLWLVLGLCIVAKILLK